MPSSKFVLLKVPVKERRETGENGVTYVFNKDVHKNLLLQNLANMQANGALMTDVILRSTTRDHEERFHSMLLAACSPVLKQRLTEAGGKIIPEEIKMTAEMLISLREFLYTSVPILNAENVDDIQQFAGRCSIEDLARMCERFRDRSEDEDPQVFQDILPRLFDMFQSKELTTTIFEDSEDQTQFSVHGPLFAAASPKLLEHLKTNLFNQEGMEYRLKHTTRATLQDFIKYVYLAEITLNYENVQDLLHIACRYQIPALAQVCCDYLPSILDAENAVGILWLVKGLDWEYINELEEETKIFIVENFEDIAQSEEFVELDFRDLIDMISNDSLNVQSEEAVYHAIIKWVSAKEEVRQSNLYSLLKCVHLEFTNSQFLEEISKDSRIQKCSQCRKHIYKHQERFLLEAKDMSVYDDFQITPSLPPIEDFEPETTSEDEVKTPRTKQGKPDMRFKVNKERFGSSSQKDSNTSMSEDEAKTPRTKQGKPDMRFKVNKERFGSSSQKDSNTSMSEDEAKTPRTKQGKPDMRFKVNKERFGSSSQKGSTTNTNEFEIPRETSFTGPQKKDGTLDMRFAVNKAASKSGTHGGTRISVGSSSTPTMFGSQSVSHGGASGPLKRDGTPDMRYAVNRASGRSYGGAPSSSGYSYTPTSSGSRSVSSHGGASGPLKRDGTPDMRYAVNRASGRSYGGAPSSSGYSYTPTSSGSRSVSSYGGASGPLKRDGTPDMRYKANRR